MFRDSKSKSENALLPKHKFFVDLLAEAAKVIPELGEIASSLRSDQNLQRIRTDLAKNGARGQDVVTFAITQRDGNLSIPLESDLWHDWWRGKLPEFVSAAKAKKLRNRNGGRVRCILTGDLVHPELTHGQVTKLPGGRTSGMSVVSFDGAAWRSYYFQQSENAAVGVRAAELYIAGLQHLIETTGQPMGGAKVVHWYAGTDNKICEMPRGQDPLHQVESMDDLWGPAPKVANALKVPKSRDEEAERRAAEMDARSRAREFLRSVATGRLIELAEYRYYALTLSGSSARVVVRDYATGRFGDLCKSVSAWFNDLNIAMPFGSWQRRATANPPKLVQILYAGLPERPPGQKYEDWIRPVDHFREQLWEAAIRGVENRIPRALVDRAVRSHVATVLSGKWLPSLKNSEQSSGDKCYPITTLINRMSLLKLFYNREQRIAAQESFMVTADLDPSHPRSAYHCGRMMAVLEMVQRLALGEVGATVAQTYYASAATRPIAAFGQLWTKAQHHLAKIGNDRLRRQYQLLMTEISLWIGKTMPRTFDLEDQCVFHLGYYHQRAYQPQADPPHKHLVRNDLRVRSKSEVIICLVLEKLGVSFSYEEELKLDSIPYPIRPDFTITATKDGRPVLHRVPRHDGQPRVPERLGGTAKGIRSSWNPFGSWRGCGRTSRCDQRRRAGPD